MTYTLLEALRYMVIALTIVENNVKHYRIKKVQSGSTLFKVSYQLSAQSTNTTPQ